MLARARISDYIIGLLFAAQVGLAQTPETKEAFEAFAAGDYRAALKLYTETFNANPTDTAAIFYQGLCYFNLGDYESSDRVLHTASFSRPFRARAYYFMAKAEEAGGAIASALNEVRLALKADSTFAPARKLLAQLLCANKQFEAAIKAIDSTATADVITSVGNCLLANARCADAAQLAERKLASDSTNFAAQLLLADAYFCETQYEHAAAIYQRLSYRAASYPRILRRLGSCYMNARRSRNDLALSYLKVYLAATGDSSVSVLSDIGRAFQSTSRFDSAAVYFAAAVRQDTALASSHFNLGLAYYQLKKYREAESAMLHAVRLSKTNLDFSSRQHYMLGAARMSQNKNKSAIQAYRKAIELNAGCHDCYYFLGTVYQTLNDYPKAATWFRSFLQRTADSKDARFDEMRKYARQFLQNLDQAKK
ncbi:MAG: tetratricopeptide repeat protein [candidate division KSB1 bacterium]|nr:tetratricopeptide repeat protein [candidate division KSB1 bacterium]MDZ7364432.1 tetratricopeptide repeat protein [candidate division KSB1 bacterium]MDZ7402804.1 tetratricopeptide repeat protein [candidate division KSB1 bacterium]